MVFSYTGRIRTLYTVFNQNAFMEEDVIVLGEWLNKTHHISVSRYETLLQNRVGGKWNETNKIVEERIIAVIQHLEQIKH